MSTVGELLVRIGIDTKPLMIGVAQAKSQMASLEAQSAASAGGIGAVGKAAGIAGAAIAAGAAIIGVSAIHSASQFESSMKLIQTQAGASKEEVVEMSKSVLALATTVPQGADVLAAGLYHVESAGFSGAKALDILTIAAQGAAVGHADLEATTNTLIAATKSGVGGVESMTGAMGTLNGIVGAGNMRMQDLNDAIGTGVLSTAKNYGVSIQSIGASLASMTTQGIPAIDAATRLNSAMRLMAAPTDKARKMLASIGLSSDALAKDMRKPNGMLVAMQDLKAHLATGVPAAVEKMVAGLRHAAKSPEAATAAIRKALTKVGLDSGQITQAMKGHFDKLGLSVTQQAAFMAGAFGGKQSGAILTLVGNVDLLAEKEKAVTDMSGKFGESWTAAQEDTKQQAEQLGSTFNALMISIGTGLLPAVNAIVQAVAPVLTAMARWAADNPQLAAVILIVVGALGLLAAAVAFLGPVFVAIGAVIGLVFSPIGLVIAAIVVAVVLLATHFEEFKAGVGVVVDAVTGFFGRLLAVVGSVFQGIADAIGKAVAFIGDLIGKAIDFWVTLYIRIPMRIASWVVDIVKQAVKLGAQVVANVTAFITKVVGFFLALPGRVVAFIGRIVAHFTSLAARGLAVVTGFVGSVVSTILGIPGRIAGLVGAFGQVAMRAVKSFLGFILQIPGKVAGILHSIPGLGQLMDLGGSAGKAIGDLIPKFGTGALEIPHDMLAFIHKGEMVVPAGPAAAMRSPRAASSVLQAPTPAGPMVGSITINNPQAESASTSLRREIDKMQRLTAFGY